VQRRATTYRAMQREAARTPSAGRLHSLCTRLATIFESRLAISVQVHCSIFFCASFPISAVPREHPARPSQTSVTAVFLVALIQASDLGLPQHLQQSIPCPPASTPDRSIRCPASFDRAIFFGARSVLAYRLVRVCLCASLRVSF